ncbi:hypothetical protein [Streptomyces xanthii]|uniref:TetR family transcriptional regulator n=1 Tax=Streptomyces xanthii TaxID=2768069 RepID=A0A7H1BHL6_9ACTN|nr:hypothetical protein [Streptomyces xanthii]QNS08221.1 hypothetical protein IAG42_34485 [Streptomyces xanthii]
MSPPARISSALVTLVAGTRRTLERVAAINDMVRAAAATNPEIRELWPDQADPRYTVIATAAKSLTEKPGARPTIPVEEAADILYGILSPELFLVLTRDRAWPPAKWEQWACDTLSSQLLIDDGL